ncbi:hypothetical protein EDI_144430 [Entamoeba dispar SAW760]|uniref:SKICH domain-containing protein n=1 Tax=Entamoeba dispar (strain ATCC PRA-260 / SAW760) TaxID=370354 RepID=B0EM19_ENTDS|nr:uncharacterized protein EDI_144430 [Entamoeba dispar SAW760]EDR24413.1 hypothetical protein EDI_144430 [Entamoeba dispar SAW760]|eukprot:EDR24413.1 hypothetical protein EDI_144430 [Entamoeba dispar SAW760]
MEKKSTNIIASIGKGSHGVHCKIELSDEDLNKRLWAGIFVVMRQFNNQYCQYKFIDSKKQESIISFDPLPDGMYEVRLFKDDSVLLLGNKYKLICVSNKICIGDVVNIKAQFDEHIPYLVHVFYDNICSSEDVIGLFTCGTQSMKSYLTKQTVSTTKNKISFDLSELELDAMIGDKELTSRKFEFRYFKNCSSIANTTAPSGFSSPFTLPIPTVHAQRMSVDYINVSFTNNHYKVWAGLYITDTLKPLARAFAEQGNLTIALKYSYTPNEHYTIKLYSNSNQLLAECELTKSPNYI